MTATELKIARECLLDAKQSGNPAIQGLAAVCEYLLSEIKEIQQWQAGNQKNWTDLGPMG